MNFQDILNQKFKLIGCSQSELAMASGLSLSVISRYLSGERTPSANSPQLSSLIKGLISLAKKKNCQDSTLEYDSLLSLFTDAINQKEEQHSTFISNFNTLIDFYGIKIKELAMGINFDASFLYRIRSGERKPSDPQAFCEMIASYIAEKYRDSNRLSKASSLFQCEVTSLNKKEDYERAISNYLLNNQKVEEDFPDLSDFLSKMNDFNLDEFIKVIHFDDIKIPTLPLQLPTGKYYYGIAQMRQAELDFFKTTVLSKSREDIFMCGDMPMTDMAEDMDFNKKWMFGIAAAIKKGLHINIIHNLDRPFEEILLGLEAWIPIYMTGQVTPYHLEDYENQVFHQLNYCSGSAILYGECIDGFHDKGRYYLSNNKADLTYFHDKASALLSHAKPLMDIYTSTGKGKYLSFMLDTFASVKEAFTIHANDLPLFTMPSSILEKVLSSLTREAKESVLHYTEQVKEIIKQRTAENTLTYKYHIYTKEEFQKNGYRLNIPDLFLTDVYNYSYEEYLDHVNATREFYSQYSNFTFEEEPDFIFQNMRITVVPRHFCIISKCKSPNIHFVIRHKKMLDGLEHFTPLKTD